MEQINLKNKYRRFMRKLYLSHNKRYKKVTNKDCSIISINCVGGVVSHELHLRFNSPTVNLWFKTKDYLAFLNNLNHYLYNCELLQDIELSNQYMYPVGALGNIKVFFSTTNPLKKQKQSGLNVQKELTGIIYILLWFKGMTVQKMTLLNSTA